MADDRQKFIKELQKAIKTSSSAVERLESRKLLAKLMLGVGVSSGDVAIDENGDVIVTPQPPTQVVYESAPSQYDFAIQQMPQRAGTSLVTLMGTLQVPRWMAGSWYDTNDGWRDVKTNTDLSFDEASALIAERIKELGLDADKVYAYPKSRGESIQSYMAFLRADFSTQMAKFR